MIYIVVPRLYFELPQLKKTDMKYIKCYEKKKIKK